LHIQIRIFKIFANILTNNTEKILKYHYYYDTIYSAIEYDIFVNCNIWVNFTKNAKGKL